MTSRVFRLPGATAIFITALLGAPAPAVAQTAVALERVTAADYARAERMLPAALNPLVTGGAVSPNWLPDDRFTYRSTTPDGFEFELVDPAARTRVPVFDHARLAAALGAVTATTLDPKRLPFQAVELSRDGESVSFDVAQRRYTCDVRGTACREVARVRGANSVLSPDGARAVFIRDWNLWVRDMDSNVERPLTTDGVLDFGYATDNAGWKRTARPIVLWSPDSKKVATFQQDERQVGDMYLVETRVGHPELRSWKYPLAGDENVAMLQRVIIDVDSATVTRLHMPPDYHRAMLGDDVSVSDWNWSDDGRHLAFVSTSRDHKKASVRIADAATGAVRTLFEESETTHFEAPAGWRVLWASNEIIWNSQRENWSHLYLYDLASGRLKNRITSGSGPVTRILNVDERARTVWYLANGLEAGQDPYFAHVYKVGLDGKGVVSITPEARHHSAVFSPSGKFMVVTASSPEHPPVVVVRNGGGAVVMPVEQADISKLLAAGWQPPMSFTVKSRDGKTDLYGQLFRPSNFDPARKYPIINNAYPGPQAGSVGSRAFAAARGDKQALAELGFIVVSIDGAGTPGRSKSFHDTYYGAMGRDNTLPDQVAGMKELASRFPWIDIERAAIWGHSGGGFLAADAMLRYPDFFKVGIAESGNHDQRLYEDDWGERYQGLLTRDPKTGADNYDPEANQNLAGNLKGKLFLLHGLMDDNVPPQNTFVLMDALIKANKDFDLLLLPHQAHGYGDDASYVMRRRWDYFVRHLLNVEPPADYKVRAMTR